MTLTMGLTTCQTCFHEAVRVDAHGFLYAHTNRHTGRQCRGSASLATVNRPPVRGATRR
jgi:hypothetical protein